MCLCVYPSKRIHVAACGSIETKFGTHIKIHLERVVGQIKITPGHLRGFRRSTNQKCGKLPNSWTDWHQIWHTCSDLSGNGHQLIIFSHLTPKGGLLGVSGGQQLINIGKVLNDWTDWHQLWHTSADSSGNRH